MPLGHGKRPPTKIWASLELRVLGSEDFQKQRIDLDENEVKTNDIPKDPWDWYIYLPFG